jgi:hypothetical protein
VENHPRKLGERLIGSMRRRLEVVRHCKWARTKY